MTRLEAAILAQLQRGPLTTWKIAETLDERIPVVSDQCRKLAAAGVVEHTGDGWRLAKVAA